MRCWSNGRPSSGSSSEGLAVVIAATEEEILEQLNDADAAYGVLPQGWHAPKLRWLQAPMANPPLGYFTPELAAHPVVVTNMRGVYNDHIATHVMAFLLAFARGLPHYAISQRNREYRAGLRRSCTSPMRPCCSSAPAAWLTRPLVT